MLQHQQPGVAAQLPADVVPGDPAVLSQHARALGRLQERPAAHVPRRGVPVALPGPQPLRPGHSQERPRYAGRGQGCRSRIGPVLLRDFCKQ